MGPRIIQHDNLDKLPTSAGGHEREPWAIAPRAVFDWRGLAVLCGFLLIGGLLAYYLIGHDVRFWLYDRPWLLHVLMVTVILFLIKRWLLVEQPGGYKVFWLRAPDRQVIDGMLRTQQTWAARALPNVAQFTLTNSPVPKAELVKGEIVEQMTLVPDSEWLTWIDRTPHLMIAGRTEAGKTTMAEAVIAQRASAGELLYVLDPHYQPGKWCGLPATGGGRGYGDVMAGLGLVMDELDRRYIDFSRGKKTDEFERLTVFIDEVPALVEWCFDGKKMRDTRWLSFAKHLGSEARKVRIAVILMTQSPLVQDILINTRMRENFTRIALGDQSNELVREAREPRRSELAQLLAGRQYTAAMEYRNEIHVLDTSTVPSLAARPVAHTARPWQPPQIAAQQATRHVVSASVRSSATVSASFSPADLLSVPAPDGRTADGQRTKLYLKAMAAHGKTREYARDRMKILGMPFENQLWTEVRRELGLAP